MQGIPPQSDDVSNTKDLNTKTEEISATHELPLSDEGSKTAGQSNHVKYDLT